ncbi:unnamed protein product, partial [Tetraodon nigroviridis]
APAQAFSSSSDETQLAKVIGSLRLSSVCVLGFFFFFYNSPINSDFRKIIIWQSCSSCIDG